MLYLHQSFSKDFEDLKESIILKFTGDWDELQKSFFAQTIADKINETTSRNQAKLDRTRKVGISFCVIFDP